MVRVALASLVAASAIGCGVVRVVPPEDPPVQLTEARNLGFEETMSRGGASGWERAESPDAGYEARGYVLELDDEVRRSGRYSASIRFKKSIPDGTGQAWGAWEQIYGGPAVAGKVIHVKGWIKTMGAETCAKCEKPGQDPISLPEKDRRGAEIRILPHDGVYKALTPFVTGTSDWTLFEARADIALGEDNLIIAPILWGKGQAWFDDLEVRFE